MQVDTELVYAYAKNKDLGPLEEFISSSHLANLQAVGDRWAARRGGGVGWGVCGGVRGKEGCTGNGQVVALPAVAGAMLY